MPRFIGDNLISKRNVHAAVLPSFRHSENSRWRNFSRNESARCVTCRAPASSSSASEYVRYEVRKMSVDYFFFRFSRSRQHTCHLSKRYLRASSYSRIFSRRSSGEKFGENPVSLSFSTAESHDRETTFGATLKVFERAICRSR